MAHQAKEQELAEVGAYPIYTKVPVQECWAQTSKSPIAVRWVVTNKGDVLNPEIRANLVAKDLQCKDPDGEETLLPVLQMLRGELVALQARSFRTVPLAVATLQRNTLRKSSTIRRYSKLELDTRKMGR